MAQSAMACSMDAAFEARSMWSCYCSVSSRDAWTLVLVDKWYCSSDISGLWLGCTEFKFQFNTSVATSTSVLVAHSSGQETSITGA